MTRTARALAFGLGLGIGDIANTASLVEQLNERLGTHLLATEEVAESSFQDILRDYPDDGPARFYLDQRLSAVRRAAGSVSSSPSV